MVELLVDRMGHRIDLHRTVRASHIEHHAGPRVVQRARRLRDQLVDERRQVAFRECRIGVRKDGRDLTAHSQQRDDEDHGGDEHAAGGDPRPDGEPGEHPQVSASSVREYPMPLTVPTVKRASIGSSFLRR